MKTIYEYLIESYSLNTKIEIDLPKGAVPLRFGAQSTGLMLWCLVDPAEIIMPISFRLIGTGFDIEDDELSYIGTCEDNRGLVWHLFEIV